MKKYSQGNRQKYCVACSMLGNYFQRNEPYIEQQTFADIQMIQGLEIY